MILVSTLIVSLPLQGWRPCSVIMRSPSSHMAHDRWSLPVVFGEALFDCFPDGRTVLGGAPFNVAWHLQGFGLDPVFISRVGNDKAGREIIARMSQWGMSTSGVQLDEARPTGRVTVRIEHGEPAFDIESEQAYDYISPVDSAGVGDRSAGLLYHGTLALRSAPSRGAWATLASSLSAPIVCDVNLRPPWWTRNLVESSLAQASWAKLNGPELDVLMNSGDGSYASRLSAARNLLERFDLTGLIVTLGSEGAFGLLGNERVERTQAVSVVSQSDTVGAGDAFSAVVMTGLLRHWDLAVMLERAATFAAAICSVTGATTDDQAIYDRHLEAWEDDDESSQRC